LNAAAELINRIEWMRRQLYDLKAVLEDKGGEEEVIAAADALDAKLIGVEENLIQLKLTGTGQDGIRWPAMLFERIAYLAGAAGSADFRPTDQALEVQQAFDGLLATDVAAFNAMLGERDLGMVVTELD
jgi:hypothetical protein